MDFTHGSTRPPSKRHDRYPASTNRTYYRREGVWVTDQWLVITGRRYPISDLRNLRTVRGPHDPLVGWTAGVSVALLIGVLAVLASGSYREAPTAGLVITFLALLPATLAGAAWRFRRRDFELWADYRGMPVLVLRSYDATAYGQICRALIRAREATAPPDESHAIPVI